MLTRQHMSVIRAALRFWSEEIRPYDQALTGHYCERAETDDDFPYADDVEWIVDNIDRLELRFAVVSVDHTNIVQHRLFESAAAAVQAIGTTKAEVAAVLVMAD